MSEETALVVIDAQMGVVGEAYQHDEVLENIHLLLDRARTSGTPVIYVQHIDPWMEPGTSLWQIHPAVAPHEGEPAPVGGSSYPLHCQFFVASLTAIPLGTEILRWRSE